MHMYETTTRSRRQSAGHGFVHKRPAIQTQRGWAISVLQEIGMPVRVPLPSPVSIRLTAFLPKQQSPW